MNLIPFYQDVIAWNSFAGNEIQNSDKKELYIDLVDEESQEIIDSIKAKDPIEFIDGLCDTLVVGFFLLALKKEDKLENFKSTLNKLDIQKINISIENLSKLKEDGILLNIEEIIKIVETICYSLDFDTVSACEEVMISNWSKFPLIEFVDPEKEIAYIESQKKYTDISYSIKTDLYGKRRYIFKNGNNKVVKPSTFKDPRLAMFVTEQVKNLLIFK